MVAHPHQRALLNNASLQLRRVADAGVLFDQSRQIFGAMDDRVVLDVGALPDLDRRLIASQHRAEPNARAGRDLDIADQHSGRCDVCIGMDFGAPSTKLEFHWRL